MAKNTDVIDFQSLVASFSLCGEKLETKFDNINDIEYIVGTQTAATGSWTGKTKSTALYAGKTIIYKLPYASSGNVSLNLTFPDGSKSGAKAVYRFASTRLTTQYGANYYVPLVFNGTYWFAFADYGASNNYDRLRIPNTIAIADGAIKAVCLVGTLDGTHYKELKNGSTFDLRYPYFYNSNSIDDGANLSTSLYIILGSLNLRTFFNDDNKTVTFPTQLYLKGTLAGNVFTVHSDIIVEEPTTPDDYLYIRIGSSYSAYQMYLNLFDHRIYKWVNGVFQAFDNTALKSLQDYQGQQIDSTYIKNISNDHGQLTVTKGNNSTQSISLSIGKYTLDTVPATVDGGLWIVNQNGTPQLRLFYNDYIYYFPSTALDNPNLTLNTSSIQVTPISAQTVTLSYSGSGEISITNPNPAILTASYDSSTKTITLTNNQTENDDDVNVNLTITLSEAGSYSRVSTTLTVSCAHASPELTLSSTTAIAARNSDPQTVTLSYLGNGTISLNNPNPSALTATYDSTTKTITLANNQEENDDDVDVNLTVNLSKAGAYAAESVMLTVSCVATQDPQLTLSSYSLTTGNVSTSNEITISYLGTGTISFTCNASSFTPYYDENTRKARFKCNNDAGDYTITVSLSASPGYSSATATIALNVWQEGPPQGGGENIK